MSYVMLWYRTLVEGYVGTLYDYVARAYDPVLGRFISADTIVPGAGNGQAFNRYMYVLGNPLGAIDPSGHKACNDTDDCEIRENYAHLATTYNNRSFIAAISDGGFRTQNYSKVGHVGIDVAPLKDWSVRAAGTGRVIVSDACSAKDCISKYGSTSEPYNGGYGNVVVIEYAYWLLPEAVRDNLGLKRNESLYLLYAHLEDAPNLIPGGSVIAGTTVGNIGSTGNSNGAHLHLEARIGKTGSMTPGEMCSDASCGPPTGESGPPLFRQWYKDLAHIDPDTIRYYDNPKARDLKVTD